METPADRIYDAYFTSEFTGELQELVDIARYCKVRGRWHFSERHSTYVLSAKGTKLTWNTISGLIQGHARTENQTGYFYEVLAMYEEYKAQGTPLALPIPSKMVEILPLPTRHPLHHAYALLRAYNRDADAPQPVSTDGVDTAGDSTQMSGTLNMTGVILAITTQPKIPAQRELCDQFASHLDRAERAGVEPEAFEQWFGRDTLDAWSRAAKKLRMHCETEGALYHHNYLSDQENAELDAYLARSALH